MEQIVIAGVEQGRGSSNRVFESNSNSNRIGWYLRRGGFCKKQNTPRIILHFFSPVEGADDTNSAILTNCHTFRIILVITLSSKYTNCTKCDAGVGGSRYSLLHRSLSVRYRVIIARVIITAVRYNCHLSLLMKNVKASPILERSSVQGGKGIHYTCQNYVQHRGSPTKTI